MATRLAPSFSEVRKKGVHEYFTLGLRNLCYKISSLYSFILCESACQGIVLHGLGFLSCASGM